MKFVDTNVLIRFLTGDVPDLAEQATHWITTAKPGEIVIGEAVLEELSFVLAFHQNYRMPRQTIAEGLRSLSSLPSISMSTHALQAIAYFGQYPKLDFVDCLLLTQSAGSPENVLTFDKELLKTLATAKS